MMQVNYELMGDFLLLIAGFADFQRVTMQEHPAIVLDVIIIFVTEEIDTVMRFFMI